LIGLGELAEASALLAPAMGRIPVPLRFEAQTQWLNALEFVTTDPRGEWELDQFDALIAQNKRDFRCPFCQKPLADRNRPVGSGPGRIAGNHHARQKVETMKHPAKPLSRCWS
jgi:hypothetical protein